MSDLEAKLRELKSPVVIGMSPYQVGEVRRLIEEAARIALEAAAQVADKATTGLWDYETKGPYALAVSIRALLPAPDREGER